MSSLAWVPQPRAGAAATSAAGIPDGARSHRPCPRGKPGLTAGSVGVVLSGSASILPPVLLADLVATSTAVGATRARSVKTALLADLLRVAGPEEAPVVAAYLSGELLQRRTGVGWASLRDLPPPAVAGTLTVVEVDAAFGQVAAVVGAGSQRSRHTLLAALWERATAGEQRLLAGLVGGELRHGALEGVLTEAVAVAAGVPAGDVRRAVMLAGALGPVVASALREGGAGLSSYQLEVGRPLRPMLAASAAGVEEALARFGAATVEWKLDGVRVQVHRDGDRVLVVTRTLDDVTARLPEVVETVLALPVTRVVLDGEATALGSDGRPRPFQVTAARLGSRVDVPAARASAPLTTWFFDVLHADGADLVDLPLRERQAVLDRLVPEPARVPRLVTSDPAAARDFAAGALAAGHEGVVVKSLSAPYDAGRRGAGWLKVKPVHTLDLVVLAAEWGHGRRAGWLSNLHLGAPDPDTGGLVMLGKTFKGLTDAMLEWQTSALLALETRRTAATVWVRPELVVEVAFDGVQTSPRYPAGMALRFARVVRHRPDKPAAQADTVAAVRAVHRPDAA